MRTTITLDPDVEALIKKSMAERGHTIEQAVNSLLRSALLPEAHRPDYAFPTNDLGEQVVPLEHALRVAGELEDDEISRELNIGR